MIDFSTPAGEDWLQLLLERDSNGALPTGLWAAVARARTVEDRAAALLAPTSAGAVRIEVSSAGPDGRFAVVLAPRQPPAAPCVPHGWSLTSQEARVAELVLKGLSNREIAAALVVSENTVQTHLRHIYEKVEVRSRTQLLARFFREQFLLDLDG
jgi:DNA-binding NarL/FixJ family response regulator